MRIFKLAQEAYTIAKEHGWHDTARHYDEILALIMTEAGEAVDEQRKLKPNEPVCKVYRREDGKPEGVAYELADICIRVMDAAGEFEAIDDLTAGFKTAEKYPEMYNIPLTSLVMDIGDFIGEARYCFQTLQNKNNAAHTLGWVISFIHDWCKGNEIDLERHIREKMEYNRTRPYKHNKQF